MRKFRKSFALPVGLLVAFVLFTVAVCCVDVQEAGPLGSRVGFASVNLSLHRLTGVHYDLYKITDWLSLIPICICAGFGLLGLCQWLQRKQLRKVDKSLILLGIFYFAVAAVYILFEAVHINYRPVLIEGRLEASYPSSTTVLMLCVMLTAAMQCKWRMRNSAWKKRVLFLMHAFSVLMVLGRLLSGVHWFTDILGGILLSGGLAGMYLAFSNPE